MRRIVYIAMTLSMLILNACQSQSENKDFISIAINSLPSNLDPRFSTDAYSVRINSLIFNSLVKVGSDLKVEPDAAKSWSLKDNILIFVLHKGLRFSNGRPLEADDILFSFQQYKTIDGPFRSGFQSIGKVEVLNKEEGLTVKVHLKEYSAKILSTELSILKILPAKELKENPDLFSNQLIGTGSFYLSSQTSNKITLKARKNHPSAPPKSPGLIFKIVRDDFTLFQKVLNEEIDIAQAEIPPDKVQFFKNEPKKFNVYIYPGLSFTYLLLNLTNSPLDNLNFRKALSLAIDRKKLIKYKLEGMAQVATSILSPLNPFHDSELSLPQFNISEAKRFLKLSGFDTSQPLLLKTSNNQSSIDIGKVLLQQFKQIGLNIKLRSFEWGTYYNDLKKGNFQLASMRWVGVIDPDIYRIALHSKEFPPGRNRGRYKNAHFDQLVEQGLKIPNDEQRKKHYKEVQKIILEELPIIPLWYNQQIAVVNKRVKNYKPSTKGDFLSFIDVCKNCD